VLATGSPKVDENYPAELPGTIIIFGLLIGWGLAVSGWTAFLQQPLMRPRRLAYLGLLTVVPMVPMLSNDIYGLFAYAWVAAHRLDVYGSAQFLPASPWFLSIGERWREIPSPYGPIGLLVAAGPSLLGAKHPLLAALLLRLIFLVPFVVVMEVSFKVFRARPFFHAIVWLNPLVLVEGAGQLHLDLIGLLAITAGLLSQSTGRREWGAVGWATASLTKWNDLITAPWFWLAGTHTLWQRLKSAAILAAVLAAMSIAAFAPLVRSPVSLRQSFQALFAKTVVPGGTVVDVAGAVADALQGSRMDPQLSEQERTTLRQEVRANAWRVAQILMMLAALVALAPSLMALTRSGEDEELVALAGGVLVVIVLTLASPKFQSWYLMSALPFFGLGCPSVWRRWWPWAIFFSVTEEFALVLPRTAVLFAPLVACSTAMMAAVCLWSFRDRFWRPFVARPNDAASEVAGLGVQQTDRDRLLRPTTE
jgi:hypothetical protein